MNVKDVVCVRIHNTLQFGVVESIKTVESLDVTNIEVAVRVQPEKGLEYFAPEDLIRVYSGYDSFISDTANSIINSLRTAYETPSCEQTITDEKAP